jgi:P-type Cu+ transporter
VADGAYVGGQLFEDVLGFVLLGYSCHVL